MASLADQLHPPSNKIPHHSDTYQFIAPSNFRKALNGRVVLITGAGKGIGRASAFAFAAAGAKVVCISRTQADLDQLVAQLIAQSIRGKYLDSNSSDEEEGKDSGEAAADNRPVAISICGDICVPSFANHAVRQTQEKLGPIDILINNAGISRISDLEHEDSVEKPWKVMETSVLGTMSFTQAALNDGGEKSMLSRGTGTIINIVSAVGGKLTLPYFSAYSAAKAAQLQYTKCIHTELKEKGVKVFAVHPCMSHETNIAVDAVNEQAVQQDPKLVEWMEKEFIPVNTDRVALPADTFVALAASDDAKVLCGTFVDATYDLEEQIRVAKQEALEQHGV